MGVVDLCIHLLNFVAPALFVALLMVILARFYVRKQTVALVWWSQVAINFVVCMVLLLAALWILGHDGTIASYTAVVLGCASSQWWMLRKI